jgi:hypothetical protein
MRTACGRGSQSETECHTRKQLNILQCVAAFAVKRGVFVQYETVFASDRGAFGESLNLGAKSRGVSSAVHLL